MATPRAIQQSIDDQIARLRRDLIKLERQRNSLSPVSTIPPEVLCEILLMATSEHFEASILGAGPEVPTRLRTEGFFRALCHTSHSWRKIALGCPHLWADIDIGMYTDARRIECAAKLARPLPISVCFNGTGSKTNSRMGMPKGFDAVRQILLETKSFGKLLLTGHVDVLSGLIQVASPQSLRALEVSVLGSGGREATWDAAGALLANLPLFVNGTSGLRSLSVIGCIMPPKSKLFLESRHLTSLSASIHRDFSAFSLLEALRAMPVLEALHMGFLYPFAPSHKIPTPVVLPHLSEVFFQGDSLPMTTALSRLRLPGKNLVILFSGRASSHESPRQAGTDFFKAIGEARGFRFPEGAHAKMPSDRGLMPHRLYLHIPSRQGDGQTSDALSISHWMSGTPDNSASESNTMIRSAMADQAGTPVRWEQWHPLHFTQHPEDLQQSVGWSLDELLEIAFVDVQDHGWLWQLLSECPKVSKVSASPSQILELCPVLHSDKGIFPFPALRKIEVRVDDPTTRSREDGVLLQAIVEALSKRQDLSRKYGAKSSWVLKTLALDDSLSPPNEHLAHLVQARRLIRDIEWGG